MHFLTFSPSGPLSPAGPGLPGNPYEDQDIFVQFLIIINLKNVS